jgi:oligopeptide transport system ATP-binding protein
MADVMLETRIWSKYFPLTRGFCSRPNMAMSRPSTASTSSCDAGKPLAWWGIGLRQVDAGKLLVGLEKPTSGTIILRGQDTSRLSKEAMRKARRNIQLVMQDPTRPSTPA